MTTKSITILPNPERYEVLTTVSTIAGHARKLVTIAAYIPPGYTVTRGRGCLSFISDLVIDAKRRYREPYLAISGDFNQWDAGQAIEDFLDISEVDVGPTRGLSTIDRIFVNFGNMVTDKGSVPPLDVDPGDQGSPSDHRVAFAKCDLKRVEAFEWISYKYLYYNEDSVEQFGEYLRNIS